MFTRILGLKMLLRKWQGWKQSRRPEGAGEDHGRDWTITENVQSSMKAKYELITFGWWASFFYGNIKKSFRDLSHDTDFLAVNESLTLLDFRARDQGEARDVGKIFNGVTMELVYANIYDEDQPHIIKRLGYFQPDWVGSQDTYEFLMRQ